jgi:hypothetical protein
MVRTLIVAAVALMLFAVPVLADKPAPSADGTVKPLDRPADLTGKIIGGCGRAKIIRIEMTAKAKGEISGQVTIQLTDKTLTKSGKSGDKPTWAEGDTLSVWLVAGSKDTAMLSGFVNVLGRRLEAESIAVTKK